MLDAASLQACSEPLACAGTTKCDSDRTSMRSEVKSGVEAVWCSTDWAAAVGAQSDMMLKRTLETQQPVLERLGQDTYTRSPGPDEREAVMLKQDLAGGESECEAQPGASSCCCRHHERPDHRRQGPKEMHTDQELNTDLSG